MGNYSTEKLRALIDQSGGLASPNRFKVELPSVSDMPSPNTFNPEEPPVAQLPDLAILCTSAQLPGKQLNVASREIGIGTKSVANGQVFTAVNLSFYITNEYDIRKYFQYWMSCIVSQDQSQPMFAGFYNNYVRPVTIHQLSRGPQNPGSAESFGAANGGAETQGDEKTIYSVTLVDAFPTQMELLQLNNQAQTAAMEMTVSLAYKTYKIL